jgi:hypothetical protein
VIVNIVVSPALLAAEATWMHPVGTELAACCALGWCGRLGYE